MATAQPSKKGSSLTESNGLDAAALLELMERATRGLGEVARSFDELITQFIDWIKTIDVEGLTRTFQADLWIETFQTWRETVRQVEKYENRMNNLRFHHSSAIIGESPPGIQPSNDEEDLRRLRAQVFASIPDSIWSEALDGFGEPDLATV